MSLPLINGSKVSVSHRTGPQQSKQHGEVKRHPSPSSFDDGGGGFADDTAPTAGTGSSTADFRILVAARIRPFTEREVRQWRQERRAGQTPEDTEEARRARLALRQPFGPDYKSLNATQTVFDKSWTRRPNDGDDDDGVGANRASFDVHEVPLPVVEVESDGRTVVLLDAQRLLSDSGRALAPVRNAFTYDYVYSSFAPDVELDAQLTEASLTGRRMKGGGERGEAAPYVIMDNDDGGAALTSSHTPAQEEQAEAEQVALYEQLALPLVDAALQGYNTCMFAYGQTGSGKTYTMMGTTRHPGLIPRLCQRLFAAVASRNAADAGSGAGPALVTLQLSYMEIYKEQVRDLLKQRPKNAILHYKSRFDKKDVDSDEYRTLKVRHHPSKGIYVDGLSSVPVRTWDECEVFLQQGNTLRTQGSTAMNAKSSRSHAIFQLQMTRRESTGGRVRGREVALETVSKINLVDLAGSERHTQAKTTEKHLAEANSINASLSTLRRVLEGLIANRAIAQGNNHGAGRGGAAGGGGKAKKGVVIPYRESLLTYVLSDNLGGNSFTVMCANVSPCAANAGETESTLRYATLAKSVVNHAKLSEAPTARVIREMRDQLRVMQAALRSAPDPSHVAELEEGVQLSEELLRAMKSRELNYEAQLHEQVAQTETLRRALETHRKQETYWRAKAQQQQREVEELREALFEATQNGSRVQPSSSAEPPNRTGSSGRGGAGDGKSPQLPSLNTLTSSFLNEQHSGVHDVDVDALNIKAQRQRKDLPSLEGGGGGGGPPSTASRDWKPTRARGTPLSLMGMRGGKQRPSHTSLPALPASALEKGAGSSGNSGGGGGVRASRHNTVATAPPSGQQRSPSLKKLSLNALAPRPPLPKPAETQKKGSDMRAKPGGTAVTDDSHSSDALLMNLRAMEPGGDGGRGTAEHQDSAPPSFYQTEQVLTCGAEAAENSDERGVVDDEDGECSEADWTSSNAGHSDGNKQAEAPHPHPHPRPLELHELLDLQRLQEQAEALYNGSNGLSSGVLEIEGVAATPSKQRPPTKSPHVAAARQAQAARDRRRSSSIAAASAAAAAAAAAAKKKKNTKSTRNNASPAESREASAEPAVAQRQRDITVSATSAGVKKMPKGVGAAHPKQTRRLLLLKQTAPSDDDGSFGDAFELPSRTSRSPHGDEGLTDIHSASPEYHEEEEEGEADVIVSGHTHVRSVDGGERDGAALAVASLRMRYENNDNNDEDAAEGLEEKDASPEVTREPPSALRSSRSDAQTDELCADDTESIAASLNRSGKVSDVAQRLQKKRQKKQKRNGTRASINSDTPESSRHYSTVDTLF
ncbi:putative kinesin [Leptomonas pyrrhocoris]|uniref:Putative kinesin n=1 Tax=Leptomonas pyrrhocoris TaxID=157538 RepID=A0A0M9FWE1_LEPPY|nr:putative kinesin [Leptomonas pyrrhocoris]KPA77266.1 putative kinesin [Leptomonas pyrrhocoris]|eukprot:XP_015655705.1 putative kinesin [Leptomonas pyrrhocoris]